MREELTRTEFWALLTEEDRQFLRELADREKGCGPIEFVAAWKKEAKQHPTIEEQRVLGRALLRATSDYS